MKVISDEPKPIKMWLDDLEEGALEQARRVARLPFVHKHVALMPDSHQGYGMPIGGVLAADGAVVPYAVGVDIGCGMLAFRTSLTELAVEDRKKIMGVVRQTVPVGLNHHKQAQDQDLMPKMATYMVPIGGVVEAQYSSALRQIGTLGGGNHFIEIQQGNDGHIWIMIHSGSRNLGKRVADRYHEMAVEQNTRWRSSVPKEWQLAFLPLDYHGAQEYLSEMQYCVDFAFANRRLMLKRIVEAFDDVLGTSFSGQNIGQFGMSEERLTWTNIAHNYASMENHFGKNVLVHRKGATRARAGEIGIIPGSQGSKSYIVRGLGNPESFQSCSHGAGRALGRNQAVKTLDLEAEKKRLDEMGVIHAIRNARDLEEAPSAYKDISKVMANQADLVEIVTELTPLAVIKG